MKKFYEIAKQTLKVIGMGLLLIIGFILYSQLEYWSAKQYVAGVDSTTANLKKMHDEGN